MVSCGSSRDTRSGRLLGGDTTAANGPGGGSPQHTPSSQTSPCERSQSLVEWHIGAAPSGTLMHPARPAAPTQAKRSYRIMIAVGDGELSRSDWSIAAHCAPASPADRR